MIGLGSGYLLLDIMNPCISSKAGDAPLSLPRRRDFPSILTFQQTYRSTNKALKLEVNAVICDWVHNCFTVLLVNIHD